MKEYLYSNERAAILIRFSGWGKTRTDGLPYPENGWATLEQFELVLKHGNEALAKYKEWLKEEQDDQAMEDR